MLNIGDLVVWKGGQLASTYGKANLAIVIETGLPSVNPKHNGLTQVLVRWLAGSREGHLEQLWAHDLQVITPPPQPENLD